MIDTEQLLAAYLRSTPDEQTVFWESLTKYCRDNNLEEGFYIPYIPLQVCGVSQPVNEVPTFSTRYDQKKR